MVVCIVLCECACVVIFFGIDCNGWFKLFFVAEIYPNPHKRVESKKEQNETLKGNEDNVQEAFQCNSMEGFRVLYKPVYDVTTLQQLLFDEYCLYSMSFWLLLRNE